MSKRNSEGKFSQTGNLKKIGELSFNRQDELGGGAFGKVFQGKFRDTIDVAIKRILKEEVNTFEVEIFLGIEKHPNIVRYYHIEEDDDFV